MAVRREATSHSHHLSLISRKDCLLLRVRQFPSLLMSYEKLGNRFRLCWERSHHSQRYLGLRVPPFLGPPAPFCISHVFLVRRFIAAARVPIDSAKYILYNSHTTITASPPIMIISPRGLQRYDANTLTAVRLPPHCVLHSDLMTFPRPTILRQCVRQHY